MKQILILNKEDISTIINDNRIGIATKDNVTILFTKDAITEFKRDISSLFYDDTGEIVNLNSPKDDKYVRPERNNLG